MENREGNLKAKAESSNIKRNSVADNFQFYISEKQIFNNTQEEVLIKLNFIPPTTKAT